MPFTAGTVAEYDILVSITEKAINDQLRALYWTEVAGLSNPLPALDNSGQNPAAGPRKRYLIDHDLTMNDVEDGEVKTDAGIFAHIDVPTISFPNRGTARLTFKLGVLQSDETVHVPTATDQSTDITKTDLTKADSALITQKIVKKAIVDVKKNLNGFTVSFEANLDRKDFPNVMQDIINPANSTSSPVTLPQPVNDKLKALSDQIFSVSTIFCTFQSAKISSRFTLLDPAGADYSGDGKTSIMDHVANYFGDLTTKANGTGSSGLPTPSNPFVLGYGISQSLKKLEDIDNTLKRDNTPACFVPRSFGLAASQTPPSLNFGLLTYRDRPEDQHDVRSDDFNAGKPEINYFEAVKTPPKFADGLMVVSKMVFLDQFVHKTFVDGIWKPPVDAFGSLFKEALSNANIATFGETSGSLPHGWKRYTDWQTDYAYRDRELGFKVRTKASGKSSVSVVAYSDADPKSGTPQSGSTWTGKADDPRRVWLRIRTFQYVKAWDDKDTFTFDRSDDYRLQRQVQVWAAFEYYIEIRSAKGGSWEMTLRKPDGSIPKYPDPNASQQDGEIAGIPVQKNEPDVKTDEDGVTYTTPGIYLTSWSKDSDFVKLLIPWLKLMSLTSAAFMQAFDPEHMDPRRNDILSKVMSSTASSIPDYTKRLEGSLGNLKSTVMLPAGQAFTFNGVDTDKDGNFLSHINYDTPTTGLRTTASGSFAN